MRSPQKTNRPSPILVVAPTLLVVIGFYAFYFKPTRRQLVARRGEVEQLKQEQPQVDLQVQTLQDESRRLNEQLSAVDQGRKRLESDRFDAIAHQRLLDQRIRWSSAQAGTMNRVIALLAENQLAVVTNQTQAGLDRYIEQENASFGKRLKLSSDNDRVNVPSIDDDLSGIQIPHNRSGDARFVVATSLMKQAPADRPLLQSKKQQKISVQGRFLDFRNALKFLVQRFPEITITGVELEQIDIRSQTRNWIISLLL